MSKHAVQPFVRKRSGTSVVAPWAGGFLSANTLLVICLLMIVGYLIIPPLGMLILSSLTNTQPGVAPRFTLETITEAYGRGIIYPSLVRSLIFSLITSTCVLIIGSFLAWLVERTDSAIRHMTDLFVLAPLLVPAVLMVSGWILLLGPKSGLINLIAKEYFGFKEPLLDVFTFGGMIWVFILQEVPLAFLWLWPAFRSMDPSMEEAALMSGASQTRVLWQITLPLLRPTLLAAWIIFFILGLGALSVPLLIGLPSGIFFYSTEIYLAAKRIPTNYNLASAYSLLFMVVAIFGIYAYRKAIVGTSRFVTVTGKAYRPRLIRLGRLQPVVTSFGIALLLLVAGLPMIVLVWNAFMKFPQAPSLKSLDFFTLENFRVAINYAPARRSIVNSFMLGLGAGITTTIIGGAIAWCNLRMTSLKRLRAILDQLATTPVGISNMIIGVSLVWWYLMLPIPIYGTHWILLIAYVTVNLPYAVRICTSGLNQLHSELEEAAFVSGAGWFSTFHRIVLRLAAPTLLSSLVYVMLRAFREYTASIFLTAPGTEVFGVFVLDMWEGGNTSILSAYVTIVMAIITVFIGVLFRVGRHFGIKF